MATTLNQYCSACTSVMDRIPPATTFSVTTTATAVTPTQRGRPVTSRSTRPAPCNCGTRYSQAMASTSAVANPRRRFEPQRICAKSGTV